MLVYDFASFEIYLFFCPFCQRQTCFSSLSIVFWSKYISVSAWSGQKNPKKSHGVLHVMDKPCANLRSRRTLGGRDLVKRSLVNVSSVARLKARVRQNGLMSWVEMHSNGSHRRQTQGQDLGIKHGENTSKAQSELHEMQGLSLRMRGGMVRFHGRVQLGAYGWQSSIGQGQDLGNKLGENAMKCQDRVCQKRG